MQIKTTLVSESAGYNGRTQNKRQPLSGGTSEVGHMETKEKAGTILILL